MTNKDRRLSTQLLIAFLTCSSTSISYNILCYDSLTRGPSISLLDLSGFENFSINGFDQFLINVSNERLQQYFMEYIFPREQREYEIEGIEWRNIMYHSNDDVLDLLFKVFIFVSIHHLILPPIQANECQICLCSSRLR